MLCKVTKKGVYASYPLGIICITGFLLGCKSTKITEGTLPSNTSASYSSDKVNVSGFSSNSTSSKITLEANRLNFFWRTKKTVAAEDGSDQVELFLIFRRAFDQTIKVGTFTGEEMEKDLARDWWGGNGESIYLRRLDKTHLVIERESFEDMTNRTVINTIEIPLHILITCLDEPPNDEECWSDPSEEWLQKENESL